MKKFAMMEITQILGERYNKDLEIIKAKNIEEAIVIYKSDRPWIDRNNCEVSAHEM